MSFTDALSKVRASAAEKGVTPYDRPLVYGNDPRAAQDRPSYPRSRSRSPPRGDYNDNPYRDERRGGRDRGDYGRSRDRSYSPGPARGGRPFSPRNNGRDRSPLRGGDDHSEVIQIESSLVGLIIGRQGENLRRIESESTCRVQFLPPSDGGPFRQCKISGPRHRRTEVKAAIDAIIDDSGMGPLNRAHDKPRDPSKGGTGALRDGEDHTQIMVPDRTVGLIIGRGGETIRDLQERSGCHINIVGESKSVNGLRPVNLIGTHESASKAKDFIMEIVESDSRGEGPAPPGRGPPPGPAGGRGGDFGGPPRGGRDGGFPNGGGGPDKTNDVMYVPSDAVGMIIGKGGETIREMQTATGCKINVASSSGPGEVEREIALIGSRDSIENAKLAIEDKVEAVVSVFAAIPCPLALPGRPLYPPSSSPTNTIKRQKNSGPGGRGPRHHHDYDRPAPSNYNNHQSASATNHAGPGQQPQGDAGAAGGAGNDPYAQCRMTTLFERNNPRFRP